LPPDEDLFPEEESLLLEGALCPESLLRDGGE
jgi:hypothetical protein